MKTKKIKSPVQPIEEKFESLEAILLSHGKMMTLLNENQARFDNWSIFIQEMISSIAIKSKIKPQDVYDIMKDKEKVNRFQDEFLKIIKGIKN